MDYKNKPIFVMIHLAGGNPTERAIKEINILQEEGVEGIIIENYHGSTREVIDLLKELRNHTITMKVGINILPNEFHESLLLANTYGADFIQVDHIAGDYKRSGTIDAEQLKSMREKYPDIEIMGGVWPKYYQPKDDSVLEDDLGEGKERVDMIVVTGEGTGKETPLDKIKNFREILGDFPLIVGAGMDTSNLVEQLSIADGAIVGSSLKPYKRTNEMISRELVKEFIELKNENFPK